MLNQKISTLSVTSTRILSPESQKVLETVWKSKFGWDAKQRDNLWFSCYIDGEVGGVAALKDNGLLHSVAVLEKYRNTGVFKMLASARLNHAVNDESYKVLNVSTFRNVSIVRNFYIKHGFRIDFGNCTKYEIPLTRNLTDERNTRGMGNNIMLEIPKIAV